METRTSRLRKPQPPGLLQMIRASFLTSILAAMAVGTLAAVIATRGFDLLGCGLALLMGLGLHIATNVYNDIYDDLQGTDRINENRNDFSGGSGILQEFPELRPRMFLLARGGLLLALAAAIGFHFYLESPLRETIWVLFAAGAFFSKYYTAAPVQLASRGLGEVSVLLAFGPMAVLLAALGQGAWLSPTIVAALPLTGLSTLSILLLGQLLDLPADRAAGKLGFAARAGTRLTASLYLGIQITAAVNVVALSLILPVSWAPLIALIPIGHFLPKIWSRLRRYHDSPRDLIPAAGWNIQLHLSFSAALILGLVLVLLLRP